MITWIFKTAFKCIGYILIGGFLFAALFLLLCMNVFTVPFLALCWLFCKITKHSAPRVRLYGMMLYPSWSSKPGRTFQGDIIKIKRDSDKQVKKKAPIRAWEERFF